MSLSRCDVLHITESGTELVSWHNAIIHSFLVSLKQTVKEPKRKFWITCSFCYCSLWWYLTFLGWYFWYFEICIEIPFGCATLQRLLFDVLGGGDLTGAHRSEKCCCHTAADPSKPPLPVENHLSVGGKYVRTTFGLKTPQHVLKLLDQSAASSNGIAGRKLLEQMVVMFLSYAESCDPLYVLNGRGVGGVAVQNCKKETNIAKTLFSSTIIMYT